MYTKKCLGMELKARRGPQVLKHYPPIPLGKGEKGKREKGEKELITTDNKTPCP